MHGGVLLLGAHLVVRVAAGLAPRSTRDRFLREWAGELANEHENESGWRLLGAAFGAFADAWALRAMNRAEDGTMGGWLGGFVSDVSVATRGMRRSPGFTLVAVATLALGLGGSAALYTLLDRVVIQPLPYPSPERLVRLNNQVPGVGPTEVWALSTAQWVYFTDHATTVDAVGVYRGDGGNVMTTAGPQHVRSVAVTAGMMDLLGARAAAGRLISVDDDTPSAASVAVLSSGFWTRVMGGDRSVVGGAMSLVAMGLVLGVLLSLAAGGIMEGLLVGLALTDVSAYVIASTILAVVALAASWIPARRASRIDPLEALRVE